MKRLTEDEIHITHTVNDDINSALLNRPTTPRPHSDIKLFLLFGPRIPRFQMKSIYLLLLIVCLQRFFHYNTPTVLQFLLSYYFDIFKNYSLSDIIIYSFFLLCPILGYIVDRKGYCHAKIVLISLIIGVVSSLFVLSALGVHFFYLKTKSSECNHNATQDSNISGTEIIINKCVIIIGLILFALHACLFYSYSIIYGLDLLEGAPPESFIMYFPIIYISINVGSLFQYLSLYNFNPNQYIFHYTGISFALFLSLVLFTLGKISNLFPHAVSSKIKYKFSETFTIPIRALRNRIVFGKPAGNNPFLYLAKIGTHGFSIDSINRTISMLKLHLTMILILPIFSVDRVMYALLSQQSQTLHLDGLPFKNYSVYYCNTYCQFQSYGFMNQLTAILFCIIMEYFFYNLTFGYKKHTVPLPALLNGCCGTRSVYLKIKVILHNYFNSADPILKKMFLSHPFGLLAISSAFTVEFIKRNYSSTLLCPNNTIINVTNLPLSIQIPQYMFTVMAEAIVFINFGQYVLIYTAKHFYTSFRGLFVGFFWFYYGLGGIIVDTANDVLKSICENPNSTACYVYSKKYRGDNNLWLIWAIVFCIYFINMILFFLFAHYRQWKLRGINAVKSQDMPTNSITQTDINYSN